MQRSDKIFIAGHKGLVGSALHQNLVGKGYHNFVLRTHAEMDLANQGAVDRFFAEERPDYVFLAAAKVGGIHANMTYPADFIQDNLVIQGNVIHAAYAAGVKRLLFLGSSCIYPKLAPQPLKEEYLLTGPLEGTNRPYALAKIAGIEMCWSYNRQFGTAYLAVMPTNLYGPGDNYHPENGHVIPALIRRFHEAKVAHAPKVTIWGTGTPMREFMYSLDMADACVHLMNLPEETFTPLLGRDRDDGLAPVVNIGVGVDLSIAATAKMIAEVVGYGGEVDFDPTRPDGTPRKLLDIGRLSGLGWCASTGLQEGLRRAYQDFLAS